MDDTKSTLRAIDLLESQLQLVETALSEQVLGKVKTVPIWLSPEYPDKRPTGEYHPDVGWLKFRGKFGFWHWIARGIRRLGEGMIAFLVDRPMSLMDYIIGVVTYSIMLLGTTGLLAIAIPYPFRLIFPILISSSLWTFQETKI